MAWSREMTRSRQRWLPLLYMAVLCAGLIFTAFSTYRDYFLRWGSDPGLYEVFDVGVEAIGETIAALPQDEAVYLSPTWGEHAVLRLHSGRREGIHAYNGRHCLIFPRQTGSSTTFIIVPGDEKLSLALLPTYFPQGQTSSGGPMPDGEDYFTVYQIPANAEAQFRPQLPAQANWDDEIRLLGYDIEERADRADGTVTVNLYHEALTEISRNYVTFIHLWGSDYQDGITIYGQVDREPCFQSYPTTYWQPGQIIRDSYDLSLSPDTPAGAYILATGFYTWPELQRLPLVASDQASLDNVAILGEIEISPGE